MKDSAVITSVGEMIEKGESLISSLPYIGSERMEEVLVLLREILDQVIL